jgi:signal peptidase II
MSEQVTTQAGSGGSKGLRLSPPSILLMGSVALVVLALDQLSKWWIVANVAGKPPLVLIEGFVRFRYTENRGAAFGFFQGWGGALSIAAIVVVVGFIYSATKMGAHNRLGLFALGLITGGALGNLVDRLRLGYVVDFVDVYGPSITIDYTPYTFPVFNVADSGVTVGAILLIITFLFVREPDAPPAEATKGDDAVEAQPVWRSQGGPSRPPSSPTPAGWAGLLVVLVGFLLAALRIARERS